MLLTPNMLNLWATVRGHKAEEDSGMLRESSNPGRMLTARFLSCCVFEFAGFEVRKPFVLNGANRLEDVIRLGRLNE